MAVSGSEDVRPALPEGEYAIVEVLGHRTIVGRVGEIERFGTKLLAVEPLFDGELLPAIMVGGASIYQFTPCTAEVAERRCPKHAWQLPSSVAATLPAAALPAPEVEGDESICGECGQPTADCDCVPF